MKARDLIKYVLIVPLRPTPYDDMRSLIIRQPLRNPMNRLHCSPEPLPNIRNVAMGQLQELGQSASSALPGGVGKIVGGTK
jgi:hypothetical protein